MNVPPPPPARLTMSYGVDGRGSSGGRTGLPGKMGSFSFLFFFIWTSCCWTSCLLPTLLIIWADRPSRQDSSWLNRFSCLLTFSSFFLVPVTVLSDSDRRLWARPAEPNTKRWVQEQNQKLHVLRKALACAASPLVVVGSQEEWLWVCPLSPK